jgi:hypothetical protein
LIANTNASNNNQSFTSSNGIDNNLYEDSSSSVVVGSTPNHFMSERIEKTLQKYSKKEILKNSALNGKQQTRNNIYPAPAISNTSIS